MTYLQEVVITLLRLIRPRAWWRPSVVQTPPGCRCNAPRTSWCTSPARRRTELLQERRTLTCEGSPQKKEEPSPNLTLRDGRSYVSLQKKTWRITGFSCRELTASSTREKHVFKDNLPTNYLVKSKIETKDQEVNSDYLVCSHQTDGNLNLIFTSKTTRWALSEDEDL